VSTALVFPGQGSQRPGAGTPWTGTPGWSVVERAAEVLGRDAAALLLTADAEALRATREAQLSTMLASLLALEALPELDVAVVAGHSLGEITALVAGGALDLDDGLRVVGARGDAMQAAADAAPGTMAAVLGLPEEEVAGVCERLDGVWPANLNAPGHVVVSGTVAGVEAAGPALKEAGARRVMGIPVGGAFHTPLMAPAREGLDAALARVAVREGRVPVLSAVDVQPYDGDVAGRLSAQLTAPVRWREVVEALPSYGVDTVVEVGPGGVLAGLVKRTLDGVRVVSVSTPDDVAALRG
jgi:[acyl-carrier-protein] S-malonyltransferase